MSRVPLDITTRTAIGRVCSAHLYVYERGTKVEVTGYTTEAGGTKVTYPLISNAEGRCPNAWFPPGSYDLYSPDDVLDPTQAWEAALGSSGVGAIATEGMGVIVHGATAGTARGSAFAQYIWIGSVSPTHIAKNDLWIDTTDSNIWIDT